MVKNRIDASDEKVEWFNTLTIQDRVSKELEGKYELRRTRAMKTLIFHQPVIFLSNTFNLALFHRRRCILTHKNNNEPRTLGFKVAWQTPHAVQPSVWLYQSLTSNWKIVISRLNEIPSSSFHCDDANFSNNFSIRKKSGIFRCGRHSESSSFLHVLVQKVGNASLFFFSKMPSNERTSHMNIHHPVIAIWIFHK